MGLGIRGWRLVGLGVEMDGFSRIWILAPWILCSAVRSYWPLIRYLPIHSVGESYF